MWILPAPASLSRSAALAPSRVEVTTRWPKRSPRAAERAFGIPAARRSFSASGPNRASFFPDSSSLSRNRTPGHSRGNSFASLQAIRVSPEPRPSVFFRHFQDFPQGIYPLLGRFPSINEFLFFCRVLLSVAANFSNIVGQPIFFAFLCLKARANCFGVPGDPFEMT